MTLKADLEEAADVIRSLANLANVAGLASLIDRLLAHATALDGASVTPRMFRVMDATDGCPDRVPWGMVAEHEGQALQNHDQDLEMLNRRGGLGPQELVAVMRGQRWKSVRDMSNAEAAAEVVRLVDAWLARRAVPVTSGHEDPVTQASLETREALAKMTAKWSVPKRPMGCDEFGNGCGCKDCEAEHAWRQNPHGSPPQADKSKSG